VLSEVANIGGWPKCRGFDLAVKEMSANVCQYIIGWTLEMIQYTSGLL
jgi:hypothetical protein